jgi:spheroidene monooxygenase
MTGPASFHILRDPSAVSGVRRLITDRGWARRQHGVNFIRVLGTSRGMSTGWSTDPHRTAVCAVWDSDDALASFTAAGATRRATPEVAAAHFALRLISGYGTWGGASILDQVTPADTEAPGEVPGEVPGEIVVITRANVRLRAWPQFVRQGRLVSESATRRGDLIDLLGFGEAPIGPVGTFSRWKSAKAVESFHRTDAAHLHASRLERSGDWFRAELFARFAVTAHE